MSRQLDLRRILLIAVVPLAIGMPSVAYPVNLTAVPSIGFSETWDSNVRNVPNNEQSDFVTRINPRLTLLVGVLDSTIAFNGGFEMERYARQSDLNRTTGAVDYGLTATRPLQLTEKWTLTPYARFVESNDSVRYNLTNPSPGGGSIDVTGTSGRAKVRGMIGSLQVAYRISDTETAGFGVGGSRRDVLEGLPGLVDDRTVSANASLEYQTTARLALGGYAEANKYTYFGFPGNRVGSLHATAGYLVSPYLRVQSRAGVSYLVGDSPGGGVQGTKEWIPSGTISARYLRENNTAAFTVSYGYQAGSYGTTTVEGRYEFSLEHRITELWSWNVTALMSQSRSTDPQVSQDLLSAGASAGVRYLVTERITLGLVGAQFRQYSYGQLGYPYTKQSIAILVNWTKPYLLF
jgi:hypothetical protein